MTYQPFKNNPVVVSNWKRPDPHADWEDRCRQNPQMPVFDLLIMCDDKDKAYVRLEEDYGAQDAHVFPNGNKIVRFLDGRFATVSDRPDAVVGALPLFERWNWWSKFNNAPDLAALREKGQVTEILQTTRH